MKDGHLYFGNITSLDFDISAFDWGNAALDAEAACANAEKMLGELPQNELNRVYADALEYQKTDGASGSMDVLDRIAEAAIRKATEKWESQPQSGHSISISPITTWGVVDVKMDKTQLDGAMYALGEITRIIFGYDPIPPTVLAMLPERPLAGLAKLMACKKPGVDEAALAGRMARIPADMPEQVPTECTGQFWLGYAHYWSASLCAKALTTDDLERAGKALYGARWQTDMAKAVGLTDRTIRAYASGSSKIPPDFWADVCKLLRRNSQETMALLNEFSKTAEVR